MNGLLSRSETIKIKRYEKDCCVFSSILRFSGRDKFHGKVVLPMLAFLFGIWFQEVAAQSRICPINGGRYSANLNEILPSLQSGYMQTLGMHDSYRAIFSYISVEEYIFSENRVAECPVRTGGGRRAARLFWIPAEKNRKAVLRRKNIKVCDFYGAEMLIFLTDHRMDLTLDSRRVTRKPKVVSGQ